MNSIVALLKRITNPKFSHINKSFGGKPFTMLDVGAGNQSASKITTLFPACTYYGLDLDRNTNYVQEDFAAMKEFYEMDLTKLDLSAIPDNAFDYINMSHVIEHLHNGDEVLPLLLRKLKINGFFYIEYPGRKSTTLPSMYQTLNFYDDPTHVRIYSVSELAGIFKFNGCRVISSGTRRNWYYIIAMPFRIVVSLFQVGKLRGNIFWDLLGFAEYLYIQKMPSNS